jgi:hypothetical protein
VSSNANYKYNIMHSLTSESRVSHLDRSKERGQDQAWVQTGLWGKTNHHHTWSATIIMTFTEYQESSSITLEWTLRGLKSIFESR